MYHRANIKLIILCLVALILFLTVWNSNDDEETVIAEPRSIEIVVHQKDLQAKKRYILLWTEDLHNDKWGLFGQTMNEEFFNECPVTDCIITADRNYMEQQKFDAVIFNAAEFHPNYKFPRVRSPHQLLVFGVFESPAKKKLFEVNDVTFNFTRKLGSSYAILHYLFNSF